MTERLRRNPEVVWREEPRGIRRATENGDGEVPCATLVYLGTMSQLNLVGAEIWKRCDGSRTEEEIVDDLLELFDAGREELARDVRHFVTDMTEKKWLLRD